MNKLLIEIMIQSLNLPLCAFITFERNKRIPKDLKRFRYMSKNRQSDKTNSKYCSNHLYDENNDNGMVVINS